MKRKFKAIKSLILIIILTFSLFSCRNPFSSPQDEQHAAEQLTAEQAVIEAADEKMMSLDSYTATVMMNYSSNTDGIEINSQAYGTQTASGQNTDTAQYETSFTYSASIGDTSKNLSLIEGYANGKTFIKSFSDSDETRICSTMTRNDYLNMRREHSDDYAAYLPLSYANSKATVDREDGGTTAIFTRYSTKTIMKYANLFKIGYLTDDTLLYDMQFTAEISKEGYYEKARIEFLFASDRNNNSPTAFIEIDFSLFNSSTVASISYADYTEIEDLDLLFKLASAFENRYNSTNEVFTVEMIYGATNTNYYGNEKKTQSLSGSYQFKNESYSYKIEKTPGRYLYFYDPGYNLPDEEYVIEYTNGDIEIKNKSTEQTYTDASTDAQEKSRILNVINPVYFAYYRINAIELNQDGSYRITLTPSAELKKRFERHRFGTEYMSLTVDAYLNDEGMLRGYNATIITKSTYYPDSGRYYYGITMTISCSFEEQQ